jgi:hypothetical protein
MTDHTQTNIMPQSPASPRARKSGKRLPATRRELRLAAMAASLALLLAVTDGASVVPAQAASKPGYFFARHPAPALETAPAPTCASRADAGWKRVPTPNPANFDQLTGVAAVSSCRAWAVGSYSGGTLIESWDGTAWTQQPSPSPGSAGNGLFGVAATSATDAWAVGNYSSSSGVGRTLTEHWNGTAWKQVPSPEPANDSVLSGVDATSATRAWAVGSNVGKTLILHWNGTAWKQVRSPSPGGTNGSALSGVDTTSATSAWAVGSYSNGSMGKTLILYWNGTTWTKVPSPNPSPFSNSLSGVSATSPANIWAVGIHTNLSTFLTLAVHCC